MKTSAQRVRGIAGGGEGKSSACDEIPGEQDEVRGKGVDPADDALKKKRLSELVEVDVADLSDPVAMKSGRQIGDGDRTSDDVDLVAGELACVEGQSCGDSTRTYEKFAAGDDGRWIEGNARHSS